MILSYCNSSHAYHHRESHKTIPKKFSPVSIQKSRNSKEFLIVSNNVESERKRKILHSRSSSASRNSNINILSIARGIDNYSQSLNRMYFDILLIQLKMWVASQSEQQMRKRIDKYLLLCGKGRELVEWIDLKKFIKIFFWDAAKGKEAKIFHGILRVKWEENKLRKIAQKLSWECSLWFLQALKNS